MFASHPTGMTMTKETVHHPPTVVNTPTPKLHHTAPSRPEGARATDWELAADEKPMNPIAPLR